MDTAGHGGRGASVPAPYTPARHACVRLTEYLTSAALHQRRELLPKRIRAHPLDVDRLLDAKLCERHTRAQLHG